MPVCAICEEVVDKVFRCAGCGVDFCKDCGDPNPKKKLCTICMPYKKLDRTLSLLSARAMWWLFVLAGLTFCVFSTINLIRHLKKE